MLLRPGLAVLVAIATLPPWAHDARAAPPWVERHLTLPAGDWAFDFGMGLAHVPAPAPDTGVGINAEMAVGLTARVELGLRTGLRFGDVYERALDGDYYGRLFDRQTFDEGADALANPEVRVRGALVRTPIVELALEGRLVLPIADGTDAGLLFGVPLSFHLGSRVRLDTGAYLPFVFVRHDTWVALNAPLDVWIQAAPRLWLGPMTGVSFHLVGDSFPRVGSSFDFFGRPRGNADVSLGFGLGYQITHYLDFKAMFLFPALNEESRDFGVGAGIQVRIE
jgi:hypothetical protein